MYINKQQHISQQGRSQGRGSTHFFNDKSHKVYCCHLFCSQVYYDPYTNEWALGLICVTLLIYIFFSLPFLLFSLTSPLLVVLSIIIIRYRGGGKVGAGVVEKGMVGVGGEGRGWGEEVVKQDINLEGCFSEGRTGGGGAPLLVPLLDNAYNFS